METSNLHLEGIYNKYCHQIVYIIEEDVVWKEQEHHQTTQHRKPDFELQQRVVRLIVAARNF